MVMSLTTIEEQNLLFIKYAIIWRVYMHGIYPIYWCYDVLDVMMFIDVDVIDVLWVTDAYLNASMYKIEKYVTKIQA